MRHYVLHAKHVKDPDYMTEDTAFSF
jgi:hypothetical protein